MTNRSPVPPAFGSPLPLSRKVRPLEVFFGIGNSTAPPSVGTRILAPITLYEAVLGGKVRVPTLGSAVELSIPKNTSSGRTFRLKGKGLPKAGGTGDLFVATRIILPDGNDAELEALMEKWRDSHPYNPRSDFG